MKTTDILESSRYPQQPIYYFAYGMLTDPHYMGDAHLVGVARLVNFKYVMYRFANVESEPGGTVYGCLWSIDRNFLSYLDTIEGYPQLYDRKTYPVYVGDKKYPAEIYVMTPHTRKFLNGTTPSKKYVNSIRRGYRGAGVPLEQLDSALMYAKRNFDK